MEDPFIQGLRPFLRQLDWEQWQSILRRLQVISDHVTAVTVAASQGSPPRGSAARGGPAPSGRTPIPQSGSARRHGSPEALNR